MSKKSRRALLKKAIKVMKEESSAEQRKSEQKKKQKQNKPKGLLGKRLGVIMFWALFSFMLLVTVVNVFTSPINEANENLLTNDRNELFENEGLEFAREFVHDYFNWDIDRHGEEKWITNIQNYFTNRVTDFDNAFDKEWSSNLNKDDIVLKKVEAISDTKARYVFSINLTLKKPTNQKDDEYEFEKMNFEEVQKVENNIRVINGQKVKRAKKYISVPILIDKDTGRMAVFDIPSFTYVNGNADQVEVPEDILSKLSILSDGFVENNVISFLNTFFEAYSSDSRDKISYILEDEKHQYGLRGTMKFKQIDSARVYKLDDNHNRFIADVNVLLEEPSTKIEFLNKYLLVIKRKEQRYVIESLNDEKYVEELILEYVADDGDFDDNLDNLDMYEHVPDYEYENENEDIGEEGIFDN